MDRKTDQMEHIISISSTTSFADKLASELIEKYQDKDWGLFFNKIILPTRRSVKTLKDALIRQSGKKTLILPQMVSFSDLKFFSLGYKEPISELHRNILLSRLVMQKEPLSVEKAFEISKQLSGVMDEMQYFGIPFEKLKNIVPDKFALHWQDTLSFLDILYTYWPTIIEQEEKTDIASYRIETIHKIIDDWKNNPPAERIIAAGFTGGLPIIEEFLKAVYHLPNGCVILPNLDCLMSDEQWESIDDTHPQYHLKKLLSFMDIKRQDVFWENNQPTEKERLLSLAMTPAGYTDLWQKEKKFSKDVLKGVRRIDCDTPQTEALNIAYLLREVLETPEKKAILVTNDRNLSRRVILQMKRWNIELDDSAGVPLSKTSVGRFFLQIAQAAQTGLNQDFLSMLKHPLCCDGQPFDAFRKSVHKWEKEKRQKPLTPNFELSSDLNEFFSLFSNPVLIPFDVFLTAHITLAESLAASADKSGAERLWVGDDGKALAHLLEELKTLSDKIPEVEANFYPALIRSFLQTVGVRPKYGMHPRLDILGPIEARLQQADLVILAGMNEGSFPQIPDADLWLNRPMRKECGLPSPEEKISQQAHDFCHLFLAPQVVLTRSLKQDGTPTIPSRFLRRLEAVLKASDIDFISEKENLNHLLYATDSYEPILRPAPVPPLKTRPQKLSVTEIEKWMRDPYFIYAKHILKLKRLDDLDKIPSILEYGNAVHEAFENFVLLPYENQKLDTLQKMGMDAFLKYGFDKTTLSFFWTRFQKTASWFVEIQKKISELDVKSYPEKRGSVTLTIKDKSFILYGKTDRIDVAKDGTVTIVDYKTGSVPVISDIKSGYNPQLALEAYILTQNGYEDLPEKQSELSITDLKYYKLSGTKDGGQISSALGSKNSIAPKTLIDDTITRLIEMINLFSLEKTAYIASPNFSKRSKYNDYEHLERISEWSNAQEDNFNDE